MTIRIIWKDNLKHLTIFVVGAAIALSQFSSAQAVCPVMGEPILENALSAEYKGIRIEFCCPNCDSKFLKDPEKYLEADRGETAFVGTFLFDPVSRKRISTSGFSSVCRSARYTFESEKNRAEFLESPELFSYPPDRESLVCPVMKNRSASHSATSGYADHEGVRYYFCCVGCDELFAQDPVKYARAVAKDVRSVTGQTIKPETSFMPTCAGCAGEARLIGADGLPTRWNIAYRYINMNDPDSARHRLTIDYAVTPRLSIGLERSGTDSSLLPVDDGDLLNWLRTSDGDAAVLPRASWFITPEGTSHPSLVLGFTADRLSTPKGQAFFLTAAKTVPNSVFTPFVSIKVNTYEGRTVFPFGVNTRLPDAMTLQSIHDGDYTHFLLSRVFDWGSGSLILARGKYFGLGVSVGF